MKTGISKNLRFLILTVMLVAFTVCFAVSAFSADFKNQKETFTVKAIGSLFNLQNGGIVADSEFVYLNGTRLDKSKSEYTIDYGAAVLIVNKILSVNDIVDVDYCYIPNTAKTDVVKTAQTLPRFQFMNGTNSMDMGLLYNAVDATNGNATYGSNFKTVLGNNFTINSNFFKSVGENNAGDFNLHNIAYSNKGLDISMGYQKSSDDFNGMNYVIGQGNDAGLAKEKGLERMNFGLNYAFRNNGLFKLAYNTVGDGNDGIKNTEFLFNNSKLNFGYTTQNIGEEFARFADIREADRNILAAERGIDRKNMTFGYDFGLKGGKLSYTSGDISYKDSNIVTKNLLYDNGKMKYSYFNRVADADFIRFDNLRESDKAQIKAEAGASRTLREFSYDLGKKDAHLIQSFRESSLKTDDGKKYQANSYNVNFGTFEGQYFTVKSDASFTKANALTSEDKNLFSGFARKLFAYSQGAGNADDIDRNSWAGQVGIDRKMTFAKYNMGKENSLTYANSNLSLESGAGLKTERINFAGKYKGKDISAYYYSDTIDKDFNRLSNLTNIEKANYNNMYGMKNHNYGFDGSFDIGQIKFADNKIYDDTNMSAFKRTVMNYASQKYNFNYVDTKIDDQFTRVNDISDSARGTYAGWRGFDRKEYTANMKLGSAKKVFDVNAYLMNQDHESLDNKYKQSSVTINYVPDSKFNMSYYDYRYRHDANNALDFNNKESILKMNKILKLGKLENNTLYAMYRINTSDNASAPINQKFVDLVYNTDASAKFAVNFNYNIAEYSDVDKRHGYDVYATQKITDKFGLTFGIGATDFMDSDTENRMKYGVNYSVNDTFIVAYNYDKVVKGNDKSKDNQSFSVSGKLPKLFDSRFISDLVANFKYDLNEASEIRQAYNDAYSFKAQIFKGAFAIERASVLDAQTKSWYNDSSKIMYKNESLFGSKFGLEYLDQKTTNAVTKMDGNTSMWKINYNFTDKFSADYALSKGAWNNNILIPVKSEEFGFTHKFAADKNISLKYKQNRNELSKLDENVWSLAFANNGAQNKGRFNVSAGIVNTYKVDKGRQTNFTYSVEYEYMLTKDKFISLVASKTTDIKQTDVEDYVSDTFGLNYRISF